LGKKVHFGVDNANYLPSMQDRELAICFAQCM